MATERFNLPAEDFRENRPSADARFPGQPRAQGELGPLTIPEDPLLQQAIEVASEQLSGEIPSDVADVIERITSERGIQSGLGLGQASRNLTVRDLGLTSLDIQNSGLDSASILGQITQARRLAEAQINSNREQFNEELNFRFTALKEEMMQWDDRFAAVMQESDLAVDNLTLRASELVSLNQRFMNDLIAGLVTSNSQFEIEGIQDNIDDLRNFTLTTNEGIFGVLGIEA